MSKTQIMLWYFKCYAETASISSHLSKIINISLATEVSRVTPIFKAGEHYSLELYIRPISLLSLVSKVQERLVHNVLMDHVLRHDLLSDRQ